MLENFLKRVSRMPKGKLLGISFVLCFGLYYLIYVALQMINPMRLLDPSSVHLKIWPHQVILSIFTEPYALILATVIIGVGTIAVYQWSMYKSKLIRGTNEDSRFTTADQATHGGARFMTDLELMDDKDLSWINWADTDGTILGERECLPVAKIHHKPDDNFNTLVCGSAGSGKTSCYFIGDIWNAVNRGESIITVDTKGGLYRAVAQKALMAGYTVKVFNVKNPGASQGIDLLGEVGTDQDKAATVAQIIFSAGGNDRNGDFWSTSAQNLIKALILAVGEEKEVVRLAMDPDSGVDYKVDETLIDNPVRGYGTIGRMFEWLTDFRTDAFQELCARMDAIFEVESVPHPSMLAWNAFRSNANEKVAPGIIQNSAAAINVLNSEKLRAMLGRPDIDLELPAKEKCLYFLNVDDQDTSKRMVVSSFFALLVQRLTAYADNRPDVPMCKVPVNLLIDEFFSCGIIPNFAQLLSTSRSRAIRVTVSVQNLEQLKANYYETWETIVANCTTWLTFRTGDLSTAKLFSDAIGKTTIVADSTRTDHKTGAWSGYTGSYSSTTSNQARSLMLPEEVMSMADNKVLVFFQGAKKPLVLTKAWYGANPEYDRLTEAGWKESDWDINRHIENVENWKIEHPSVLSEARDDDDIYAPIALSYTNADYDVPSFRPRGRSKERMNLLNDLK